MGTDLGHSRYNEYVAANCVLEHDRVGGGGVIKYHDGRVGGGGVIKYHDGRVGGGGVIKYHDGRVGGGGVIKYHDGRAALVRVARALNAQIYRGEIPQHHVAPLIDVTGGICSTN